MLQCFLVPESRNKSGVVAINSARSVQATLGQLALGAAGLVAWRREEEENQKA
jgi:hypothetical protein